MKCCNKCKQEKALTEFSRKSCGRYLTQCKPCFAAYAAEYRKRKRGGLPTARKSSDYELSKDEKLAFANAARAVGFYRALASVRKVMGVV